MKWLVAILLLLAGCHRPVHNPTTQPLLNADTFPVWSIKLRPLYPVTEGLEKWTPAKITAATAGLNRDFANVGIHFHVLPADAVKDDRLVDIDSPEDWGRACKVAAGYADRGELAVWFVGGIRTCTKPPAGAEFCPTGTGIAGVANYPPLHGIAIAGASVVSHEIGHALGLPHTDPVGDCDTSRWRGNTMSYCADLPRWFSEAQIETMRRTLTMWPRREIATLVSGKPDRLLFAKGAEGPSGVAICD